MIIQRRMTYGGVSTRELGVEGSGPIIVLLHPFGLAARTWESVLALLERAGHTARAVDLVGFGEADPLESGPLLPQLNDFVGAVVSTYAVDQPVILAGNSLGAYLALHAAAHLPQCVAGVVTIGCPGTGWTMTMQSTLMMGPLLRLMLGAPIPHSVRTQICSRAIELTTGPWWKSCSSAHRAEVLMQLQTPRTARCFLHTALSLAREITDRDASVPVDASTVIVHGRRDRLISYRAAQALRNQIPASRLVVLPRSGHCAQLDEPDQVAALIGELAAWLMREPG